jgi:quercetin dioxygenase-like cupin family protein
MSTEISEEMALTSTQIGELPWQPMNGVLGVSVKTLWREAGGRSYAGLMRFLPGATLPYHRHRSATHHVWVEGGSCRVGDRTLGPGAYLHVPVGVEHGIDEAGEGGCTLLYLYLTTAEPD